jgi:hypothetical protein
VPGDRPGERCVAQPSGRPHEPSGDRRPQMDGHHRPVLRRRPVQNSAYRPLSLTRPRSVHETALASIARAVAPSPALSSRSGCEVLKGGYGSPQGGVDTPGRCLCPFRVEVGIHFERRPPDMTDVGLEGIVLMDRSWCEREAWRFDRR